MQVSRKSAYFSAIILYLVGGGLVGAVAYVSYIPPDARTILRIGLPVLWLAAWLALRRNESWQQIKTVVIGLFAVSLGVLLAKYLAGIPLDLAGFSITTIQGVALAKFGEALPIVLSILVVHFATGGDREGLFLTRGNLKLWLTAGLIGAAVFVGIGVLQVLGSDLEWSRVAATLPWILLFVFSNAVMEELWFRALFLKKLEPLVGARTTLVITSLVFVVVHTSATYVIDIVVFGVAVMALGLLWAWLMRKSNSIWGAVLIHAAGDVLGMLGFLIAPNL